MSGGPRSLHQLGNKLIQQGLDVYVYYGYREKAFETNTPLYSDSKMKIAHDIEDKKENLLIVPESDTGWLSKYHNIKKVIWWLSLYFYLENNIWWLSKFRTKFLSQPIFFAYLRYLHIKIKNPTVRYLYPNDLKKVDYHLYNCEYVHNYLIAHDIPKSKMEYLCGPIDIAQNDKHEVFSKKTNLVLYNPAKASPYMLKKILKYMQRKYPNYKLQPLQGISHDDVLKFLKISKVYLDLGYFPGPERMPREACMNYCNIITSTVGAAANKKDVPIPNNFKFDLKKENVPKICKLIVDMCDNYEHYVSYYDEYREKTIGQINSFESNVSDFVKNIKLINEKVNDE